MASRINRSGKSRRFSSSKSRGRLATAGAVAFAMVAISNGRATAATDTWVGNDSANWADGLNWPGNGNSPPASGDSLVFGAAGTSGTSLNDNLGSAFLIDGINFLSGASAYTFTGNSIDLAGAITDSATGVKENMDLNAALSATEAMQAVGTATLYLGGNFSGTNFGLTFGGTSSSNSGVIQVAGANTYTGTNTINYGTVQLSGVSATLGSVNDTLAMGTTGPATLDLNGENLGVGILSGGASNTIILNSAASTTATLTIGNNRTSSTESNTYTGIIEDNAGSGGTVALVKVGADTERIDTTNPYSGGTTISGGALRSATGNGFGISTSTITMNGGTLWATTGNTGYSNPMQINANTTNYLRTESNSVVFSGAFTGAGTVIFSGNNNGYISGNLGGFTGTIDVEYAASQAAGVEGSGSYTGGTHSLYLNTAAAAGGGNAAWIFGNQTPNGSVNDELEWNGTSSQTIALGSLAGSTTAGLLKDNVASTTVTFQIGALNTNTTFAGSIINGLSTDTVAVDKVGSGALTLSGSSNTYTGPTSIDGGTLIVSGTSVGTSGYAVGNNSTTTGTLLVNGTVAAPVAVNGGSALGGTGTISGAVTVAAGGTAATQGTFNLTGSTTGTLTLSNAAGLTLGGSAGNSTNLNFAASATSVEQLSLGSNNVTVDPGGATINITNAGIANISGTQTFTLMTFGSGSGLTPGSGTSVDGFTLADPTIILGLSASLNVTSTSLQLVATSQGAPANAYWSGSMGSSWTSYTGSGGNFTTTLNGASYVQAEPNASTNVYFADSGATNLTNTLGTNISVSSLTFLGSNTSAVTINPDGNTLTIEGGGLTVQSGAGAVTIASGVSLGAAETWSNASANNLTINGAISGASGNTLTVDNTSTGLTILSGINSFSGGTILSAGTLQLSGNSTSGSSGGLGSTSGSLTVNAGTLDLKGTSQGVGALSGTGGTVTNTAASTTSTLTLGNGSASGSYSGSISDGAGLVAVISTGTEILSGSDAYSGGTSVSGGTLQVGSASALGSTSGPLVVNSGTLDLHGFSVTAGALSGTTAVGVITSSSSTAASATLTVGNSGNSTYAGAIDNGSGGSPDTVSLVKVGSGTLTLSGAGTYSGGTVIKAGTIDQVAAGSAGALGTGTITLGDGSSSNSATLLGTVTANTTNANPIVIAGGGTGVYTIKSTSNSDYDFSGNVTLDNPVTLVTTAGGAMFFSGTITGSSLVTIDGGGTTTKFVDFDGSNLSSFTGNLLIQDKGNFKTTSTGVGVATTVSIDSTSTYDNGSVNETIAGVNDVVSGAGGTLVVAGGSGVALTLGGSGSYSFSGVINNSGGIVKAGTGTQTIAGASTYTGGTAIDSGTLIVANASGSATGTGNVTMNGGVLASSGATAAISGNVVDGAASAYTIAPGGVGTVGTLTLGGLTTTSLGTLNFDLGTGSGEITNGDLLVLGSGTVSIGSGTNMSFGGTPVAGNDYRLIGDQSSGTVVDAIPLGNFSLPSAPAGLAWSLNNTVDMGYIDLVVATSGPLSLTWNNAGGNNLWDTSSDNWNSGSGNTVYADPDTVTFNDNNPSSTAANYSVTLNSTVHPGGVTVNSSGSYTISGTGSIAGTGSLTQSGTGTLVLDIANTYTGGTSVSNGKLIIERTSSTTSALPDGALSITGGIVQLATNVTAGSQPTSTPASNVNLTSLAINGNGTLDITNNHIIVDYTPGNDPIASIAAWIRAGYNSGTWTGDGIMSSTAQSNASYGIGYADAADAGNPAGLSSGQIEIAYTLLGDANLDYKVNGADFTLMAANFNDSVTAGWDKGDFNYSNTVNGDDFVLLADNFNQFASQSAVSAADLTALDDFASANGISLSGVSSVPEPASVGLLAAGTIGVLSQRRRKSEKRGS